MSIEIVGQDALVGQTLGHYRIIERIGAGGMGEVFRGHDERLGREVAIKVLPPGTLSDEAARKRFHQEAIALSKLNHPNICTIYDVDKQAGQQFIVMELLEGHTLAQRISGKPLRIDGLLTLAVQMADALEAAHAKGIVHRDVKPTNIFIVGHGQVKILDFGLAKFAGPCIASSTAITEDRLTAAGATMGTIEYLSPEQARGEEVDARADLFSFGLVLYEMSTGRPAFSGNTPALILEAILNREPIALSRLNPSLPVELERIVGKAIEKDRELRYQTAADFRADLKRLKRDLDSGKLQADKRPRSRELSGRERKAVASRIKAIAVLPLANLSRDPEQDYFADGMTEALITDLAQIGALRVISRTSAMRYKGTDKPLPEIARELNVDGLVEGSVLRVGERVRITAQLIHAATDQHVWAKSYERDLRDVLALQGEVAGAIAEEVQIKLTPQERVRLARSRPVDPAAHEAYLKGRYHWAKGGIEGLTKSIACFEEAIAEDPSYALPYAGLVDAYNFVAGPLLEAVPVREITPKATAAVAKALELDDGHADAHISLGRIKFYFDWDWAGAEKAFQRAIELNPNHTYAHLVYALLLSALGQHEKAIREAQQGLQLDPVSLLANFILGTLFSFAHQFENAERQLRKTLDLDPNYLFAHQVLGSACLEPTGRYNEAIAELQKAVALAGDAPLPRGGLGFVYAKAGRKNDALGVLAELEELSQRRYVSPIARAVIYVGLGDERMWPLFEEAFEQRCPQMVWASVGPQWDEWRADPRAQTLLRRMNLLP